MKVGSLLLLVWASNPSEVLQGVQYRAVTLEPEERKAFTVPRMDRMTASSGACIEEEVDVEQSQTLVLRATCGGVRTSMVWLDDGTRIHMLACAEDKDRRADLVRLRKKVQGELRSKSATACVRGGQVELWGWVSSKAEQERVHALAKKHGAEDKIELLEEGGGE